MKMHNETSQRDPLHQISSFDSTSQRAQSCLPSSQVISRSPAEQIGQPKCSTWYRTMVGAQVPQLALLGLTPWPASQNPSALPQMISQTRGRHIFFHKETDNVHFQLCRPCGLCCNCSTLLLEHESNQRQYANECLFQSPNKTLSN